MELEPLIQRVEIDARAYMTALDQVERRLGGLGKAAGDVEVVITEKGRAAAAAYARAADQMNNANRRTQFAFSNTSNQVADFFIQVQAGADPLRAFTQQLSQALIFIGPWGAALGAAAAVAGGLGTALLSIGDSADDASDGVNGLLDRLDALGTKGVTSIEDVLERMQSLSTEMQRLAGAEIGVETSRLVEDLEAARIELDALLEQAGRKLELGEAFGVLDPEAATQLQLLVAQMRQGQISADEFIREINRFREAEGAAGETAKALTGDFLDQALTVQRLTEELRKAGQAGGLLGAGATFLPEPPEQSARAARAELASDLGRSRGRGRVRGGRTQARQTTFEDIVVPLEREVTLLGDVELAREAITSIMQAEQQLKRALTDAEREHLLAVLQARDGLLEQRNAVAQLAREWERVDERQRQVQLRETTGLRERREQAVFESGRALEAGTADILGIPPSRGFFEEQERFRLQQQGLGAGEIADMEPLIEDLARAQQHMQLMTETAPALAGTLADIGQTAVFEGMNAAGEQFLGMLVNMIFQVTALRLVMATLGVFGAGAPAAAGGGLAPGVGPGGMGFLGSTQGLGLSGFGGPRQHGGSVRRGAAYLVGEAGPELFVPSEGGAVVPGRMSGAGGAPGITVNISNTSAGAQVTSGRPRMGADGRPVLDVLVADSLDRMHGGGQLDRMMGRRTGVRRS